MRNFIPFIVLLVVSGCASILESVQMANTENLLIQTPNVEGAECRISDGGGRKWYLWETPGTVAVQGGHPPLVIICTKRGMKKSILTIDEHKKELLTIDGKRIDVSLYNQFPTKFPRLIPAAIKETVSFAKDPTGSISTQYPNTITVWMEPKKWKSEEQMRTWAFDRKIHNNADLIKETNAKKVDDARKVKRRAEQAARKEKVQDVIESSKDSIRLGAKKGFKNMTKMLNPSPILKSVNETGIAGPTDARPTLERAGRMLNPITAIRKAADSVNPANAMDALNKRREIREEFAEKREEQKSDAKVNIETNNQEELNHPVMNPIPYRIYQKYNKSDKNTKPVDEADKKIRYDEKGYRIAPWKTEKN